MRWKIINGTQPKPTSTASSNSTVTNLPLIGVKSIKEWEDKDENTQSLLVENVKTMP